jgi:hypothetical protein
MVVAVRDLSVTDAGPIDPENGVRTLFLRNNRTGQTAECRVNTIDAYVLSVTLGSSSNSVPREGSFAGRGRARGSVFGTQKQATEASFNFNQQRFSLGIFTPSGVEQSVQYQGIIKEIRNTNPNNPNSFLVEATVDSFASSLNNRRVVDTTGTCRLEVFDGRLIEVSCSTNLPNSTTVFTGMKQF